MVYAFICLYIWRVEHLLKCKFVQYECVSYTNVKGSLFDIMLFLPIKVSKD